MIKKLSILNKNKIIRFQDSECFNSFMKNISVIDKEIKLEIYGFVVILEFVLSYFKLM